jgi:tRNA modification GTPase
MHMDTIAAIATAPGAGGIGIVRLSGPDARSIGEAITAVALTPRHAHFCRFYDATGVVLDTGISLFFPAPNSFTGECVVELQAHGGPIILDMLLRELCNHGARQALPGEFSHRAYLNNKIDLAQAEAIADLINSTTEQAALNASRSLQGVFSDKIEDLISLVTSLRVYVEAAIDFPEEEIDFLKNGQISDQLLAIIQQFDDVMREAKQGAIVQEGMKLVIAGRPNAGKSSLLNALSGHDTAIVTAIEGTTRDVLREHIQIDGLPIHIVDTAGLRDSDNEIEQEGIRRAWTEIDSADRILLVVDGNTHSDVNAVLEQLWQEKNTPLNRKIPVTIIRNKCDLTDKAPEVELLLDNTVINVSAKSGAGIDLLKTHLKDCIGYTDGGLGSFSARRRHLQALKVARNFFLKGQMQLIESGAGELLAEDLRLCQNSLGDITGAVSSDDLLGTIFSNFCIGK